MNTTDLISEQIKEIEQLLKGNAKERFNANMKGRGNLQKRLVGKIMLKGNNESIIEVASKIIETLQKENKELSESIKDIQSRPPE